jgi:predicted unusual protein kinase regulating ubiquinone biosynthesis (AarF/ABC1/UbiB family)
MTLAAPAALAIPAPNGPEGVLYVLIALARAADCDACARSLDRGTRARRIVDDPSGLPFRVRCLECFEAGREPPRVDMPVEAPIGTNVALARPRPAAWAALTVAGLSLIVTGSRGVRRALVTAGAALRAGWSMAWGKLRGKRDVGPVALREAFEQLGPTYVKLGQLVASSQGLFPEAYCRELQKCLDRVPPFPYADVERILREDLGRDPSEVFSEIDPVPLASASIAQVHAARLVTGEEVVIKVQRPDIEALLSADLRVLKGIAWIVARVPHGELANPEGVVEDFGACLSEEVDFTLEAKNLDEFNRIMAIHGHAEEVAAPKPRHDLTTRRVLVMERFRGHRVDDVAKLAERGLDGEAKLLLGMRAWFRCMIFHGFFHGDVHAGNLMALDDGRIGFLDFGIVGRFGPERRTQVTDYLLAFSMGDFRKLADVMVSMGSIERDVDLDALSADLAKAYAPLLEQGDGLKYADLIPVIMKTGIAHGMRLPRDFVLVTKQMLYFDRYAKVLAPGLNLFRDPRVISALAEDVTMATLMPMPALSRMSPHPRPLSPEGRGEWSDASRA